MDQCDPWWQGSWIVKYMMQHDTYDLVLKKVNTFSRRYDKCLYKYSCNLMLWGPIPFTSYRFCNEITTLLGTSHILCFFLSSNSYILPMLAAEPCNNELPKFVRSFISPYTIPVTNYRFRHRIRYLLTIRDLYKLCTYRVEYDSLVHNKADTATQVGEITIEFESNVLNH